MNHIDQFKLAMREAGLAPPDTIKPEKWTRFATDKKHSKNGWLMFHEVGELSHGSFGDWASDLKSTWCSVDKRSLSEEQRAQFAAAHQAAVATAKAEQQAMHDKAAEMAGVIWDTATPATQHGYRATKGIQAHGTRVIDAAAARALCPALSSSLTGLLLVIPMRDGADLRSLQFITEGGIKRPLTGGQKQGCYYAMGSSIKHRVIVAEGFATAASINEATSEATAVAFDRTNLKAVAMKLKERFKSAEIVMAGDDDHQTEGNPGRTDATAAAQAVGGRVVMPAFKGTVPPGADFNDLHKAEGLASVKACFGSDAQADYSRKVMLTCGADLTPEPVLWVWDGWLAQGKLHLLAGTPGQGKTTLAMAMAATVTIGGVWPDGSRCEPGNVLVWSGEDDPADTLLPRLMASGADRSRCYFISGVSVNGEITSFDPAKDMAGLEAQAKAIGGVKLLIIDPVVSAVSGDSHKNAEVRRDLQPIVDLASKIGAAAIGITHLSKGGTGTDPAGRVIGSVAFTAVARVVMVAGKVLNEDGTHKRILARGKSNIGPDEGGFEYHIEQAEPLPGINACCISWGAAMAGTARELLQDAEDNQDGGEESHAIGAAKEFLEETLSDCPVSSNDIKASAKEADISWRTIRRASDILCIKKKPVGTGKDRKWFWQLPGNLSNLSKVSNLSEGVNAWTSCEIEDIEPKNELVQANHAFGQVDKLAKLDKLKESEPVEIEVEL